MRGGRRSGVFLLAAASLCAALWAYACGDGATEPTSPPLDPPRPTTVTVSPAAVELVALGATAQLAAEVRDQNAGLMVGVTVIWESGTSSVAMVDGSGLVTAVGNGTATITASAGSASGSAVVTVAQSVASVEVSPPTAELTAIGASVLLTAKAVDENGHAVANAVFSWESSDSAVATVEAAGVVTAVAEGTATITAQADSMAENAVVTVQQAPASVSVVPDSLTFEAVGDTATITATVLDANGHAIENAQVAWSSGDTTVAAIDATGLVTAASSGRTEVTATVGGLVASAPVVVEFRAVSISIEPSELAFSALGDTATLTATALDGAGRAGGAASIQWASGDTTVAVADASGLVTAVGNGTTSVSATAGSVSASATVSVQQIPATLSLEPESLTFEEVGDTATVMAAVADANEHEMAAATVAWASDDPAVAAIDPTGLVTAIRPGSTEVTARVDSLTASVEVAVLDISTDRDVLEFLYHSTGGDGWRDNTNWLTDAPLSEWAGVVTDRSGRVLRLRLRDNGLQGSIPRSLGRLDQLNTLNLGANSLTGGIPPEIGELRRLRDLRLYDNELSGPLPPQMGDLAALRSLTVWETDLSGPVPETFARLHLDRFLFRGTNLCLPPGLRAWYESIERRDADPIQCIPVTPDRDALAALYRSTGGPGWDENENWLSDLPINTWSGVTTNEDGHVTQLVLPDNNLSGPLPPEIGDLLHLERLWLHGNALSGTIPPEIGKLAKVRDLSLSSNQLEGPIPPEVGGLASVDTLYLSINNLSGPIPMEIGDLESLVTFALFKNQLTGPLPSSLGKLKRLEELYLQDNRIDGPLPREIGDMTSLTYLSISRNQVSGSLPPELGKLKALEHLSVNDNRMVGAIPPELGDLTSLEDLLLPRNGFSGSIPLELGRLGNLEYLWLFQNELTGDIPPELGNLGRLKNLSIGTNPLTGGIPPELGRLPALEVLHLGRTNLSGAIPRELGQLPSLTSLGLCSNNLSGSLPPELGDIGTLERLSLCHNPELSGLLPRRLMNLEFLSEFLFYQTGLCPQIDDEFQEWLIEVQAQGGECDPARIERLALSEFFARTGGDSWTNRDGWNSGTALSSWHGVTVADGRVHQLALPANGLRGLLAPEIANLTELRVLNLGDNHLSGDFPVAISSMTELDTIRVSGNRQMEGRLPFRLVELRGLGTLAFANTGLCASPAETFQRWLGGLQVADGATCGNPERVTLSMPVVYLTQAVQRPAGDVPLIQGRDALLRVFLTSDESQAFFEPEVVATLSRGGQEVHRVVMRRGGDLLTTFPNEGDLRDSYNAVIPTMYILPGTELVVEADPGGLVPLAPGSHTRFPASGAWPLNVVEVPPMELTVVPVVEAEQPDSSIYEWTDNIGDDSPEVGLLRNAFPISEFRARTRETYVTSLDLTTESGQWGLRLELEAVRAAENGRGYWYGAASSVNGQVRGLSRFGGWVSLGRALDEELAHEVGHNFDLRHAPCGGALYTDPEFPYANGSIGVWGYDFRDGTVLSPDRRRDIMGYCYEQGWLSDYYFEKVIDYRAQREAQAARAVADAGPRSEMLVLWGGVVDGELRIEPPFPMTTTARLPEEAGPYRLEGTGSDGQVELSLGFTPGEDKFGNKYFFFTVPIEEDWAESLDRLVLTGPEGTLAVNAADERSLSVVTDPATGRIKTILRDWEDALPTALGLTDSLTVTTVRGLGEAVRLRR